MFSIFKNNVFNLKYQNEQIKLKKTKIKPKINLLKYYNFA
jgi:hypothetical protein